MIMAKKTVGFLLAIGCPVALSFQVSQPPVMADNSARLLAGTTIAQQTAAATATPAAKAADDDADDSDNKPPAPAEKSSTVQTYKATAATSQAAAKESAEVIATVQKAYAEIGKGNNKEALKLITEQMKKEPNSIAARRYYAFALVHNDSPKSAIEQILYQMPRLPGYQRSAFDWCTLGDAYLQAASFDNAETSYNGALRLEPENYAAKGGLLRTTAKKGKVDDALKQCDLLINQYAKQPAVQAYYKGIYALLLQDKGQPATPQATPANDGNQAPSTPAGGVTIPDLPEAKPRGG
jgi:tetratricopeptide (TPR) repeat protein